MAATENLRWHNLRIDDSDGTRRIDYVDDEGFTFSVSGVTGENNQALEIGQTIRLDEYWQGERTAAFFLGQYVGRTAEGMVIQWDTEQNQYFFATRDFEMNDVIDFVAEPYPVCFVKGSSVQTARGLVSIENLVKGDQVRTSAGWGTVKWLGWRHYGPSALYTLEQKANAAPVRIGANAIAENVPSSDLLVSPWHHVMVDGHLVRANDLVNGTTIVQETQVTSVDYYHVELEQFDVIMAHGIYSESWADGGNRSFFQNADVTALRPTDFKRRRASRPGFDHLVLRKGRKLEAVQKKVAKRAQLLSQLEVQLSKAA